VKIFKNGELKKGEGLRLRRQVVTGRSIDISKGERNVETKGDKRAAT
jgi:hypothetical protein